MHKLFLFFRERPRGWADDSRLPVSEDAVALHLGKVRNVRLSAEHVCLQQLLQIEHSRIPCAFANLDPIVDVDAGRNEPGDSRARAKLDLS